MEGYACNHGFMTDVRPQGWISSEQVEFSCLLFPWRVLIKLHSQMNTSGEHVFVRFARR